MPESSSVESALKRDRWIVASALGLVAGLSWVYTIYLAWQMGGMDMGMVLPQVRSWGAFEALMMFVMWVVMMIAMMTPTATPMILLFASINRKRRERDAPYIPTAFFLSGYLLAWVGFSAAATLAQWGLHQAALLSPMMMSTSAWLGGGLLMAAGVFQWLPLKNTCLRHCRSPLGFLTTEWAEGARGALRMGLKHGSYCAGCCWALMALLFVGGVMNLLWIGGLTVFVLLEKVAPRGELIGRLAGLVLVGFAIWMVST